jgi:hypothetical protein
MKVWKTCQLRRVQGAMQARRMRAARVALRRAALRRVGTRRVGRSIQRTQTGRKMRRVELERAMRPQRRAKTSQEVAGCRLQVAG